MSLVVIPVVFHPLLVENEKHPHGLDMENQACCLISRKKKGKNCHFVTRFFHRISPSTHTHTHNWDIFIISIVSARKLLD